MMKVCFERQERGLAVQNRDPSSVPSVHIGCSQLYTVAVDDPSLLMASLGPYTHINITLHKHIKNNKTETLKKAAFG